MLLTGEKYGLQWGKLLRCEKKVSVKKRRQMEKWVSLKEWIFFGIPRVKTIPVLRNSWDSFIQNGMTSLHFQMNQPMSCACFSILSFQRLMALLIAKYELNDSNFVLTTAAFTFGLLILCFCTSFCSKVWRVRESLFMGRLNRCGLQFVPLRCDL